MCQACHEHTKDTGSPISEFGNPIWYGSWRLLFFYTPAAVSFVYSLVYIITFLRQFKQNKTNYGVDISTLKIEWKYQQHILYLIIFK